MAVNYDKFSAWITLKAQLVGFNWWRWSLKQHPKEWFQWTFTWTLHLGFKLCGEESDHVTSQLKTVEYDLTFRGKHDNSLSLSQVVLKKYSNKGQIFFLLSTEMDRFFSFFSLKNPQKHDQLYTLPGGCVAGARLGTLDLIEASPNLALTGDIGGWVAS